MLKMLSQRATAMDHFKSGIAHCGGHWQADYARQHAALLAAPHDRQRIAVVDLSRNGLADRLTTAISVFYFALLSGDTCHCFFIHVHAMVSCIRCQYHSQVERCSCVRQSTCVMTAVQLPLPGRAFRIHWPADDHRIALENILTAPYIDWRFQDSDVQNNTTHWEVLFRDNLEHPTEARDFQLYGSTNLSLVGADMRTVWWSANAGDPWTLRCLSLSNHTESCCLVKCISACCPSCCLKAKNAWIASPSGPCCADCRWHRQALQQSVSSSAAS